MKILWCQSWLFYLINNTTSDIDRARLLNLLWIKAKEINIERALYNIYEFYQLNNTAERVNWFTYPVTRALISNNKLEEAKNWLFFITMTLKIEQYWI